MPYPSYKNKGFVPVKRVLENFSSKPHLKSALNRRLVIQAWNNVVGIFLDEAKGQTKAIDYRNGTLSVACLSKNLAYEIKILTSRIIAEINQQLGCRLVYSLVIED